MILISYTLEVYGHAWGGFKAVYSYACDAPITTNTEALKRAGDFASLIDWRCVRCTTTYESTRSPPIRRRTDEYRTLRGFRNGMRPARFYRLANA